MNSVPIDLENDIKSITGYLLSATGTDSGTACSKFSI